MKTESNLLGKIRLISGRAVVLAFAMWLPCAARAAEHQMAASDMQHMQHITTQAQAEA